MVKYRHPLAHFTNNLSVDQLHLLTLNVGLFSHYYIHIYEDQQDGTGLLDEWTFPVGQL